MWILDKLKEKYPIAKTILNYNNPFELLIAVVLSAQSKDVTVNNVTELLFEKYPTSCDIANATDIKEILSPLGLYEKKSDYIISISKRICSGEKIDPTIKGLTSFPGVGRKTASVVLGEIGYPPEGFVVDTHVSRVSKRFGLTNKTTPLEIEKDLMNYFPRNEWIGMAHRLIFHGRDTCDARWPKCENCILETQCLKKGI